MVTLAELVDFKGGGTPNKAVEAYWNGSIPWASVKDFKSSVLNKTIDSITEDGLKNSASNLIPAGNLIVPTRMALGKVAINEIDLAINQDLKALIVKDENVVNKRYLFRFLESKANFLESEGKGATVKGITLDVLKNLEIPLPNLDQQKRIAAILDKADSLRRKNQQAIQLADQFLRAVFLDMFGELFTDNGYRTASKKPISELATYIDYRGKTPQKSESGIPLITAKNVKKGFISQEPREFIPESNYENWMTRGQPLQNDVLFTTEAPLGNVALLGKYDKVAIGQRLVSLRSKGELTQEYLLYCLLNPYIQNLIDQKSSGSTAKGIRTKELYQIELPIPEISWQNQFSSIYKKTTVINQRYGISENSSHDLFKVLSQKSFKI